MRIDRLDSKIDHVQAEQIHLDMKQKTVKELVVTQQRVVEAHEAEKRQSNLIFYGVPEADVLIDNLCLKDDKEKVNFLCKEISKILPKHLLNPTLGLEKLEVDLIVY